MILNTSSITTNCYLDTLDLKLLDIYESLPVFIITCVLNAVFALTAVISNGVVLLAVWNTPALHTPTNALLCCLCVTDFLTGFVSQTGFIFTHLPLTLIHNVDSIQDLKIYFQVHCTSLIVFLASSFLLSGMSFLTLTAVHVDRYLAIVLHLRYNELVTVRRVLIGEALLLPVVFVIVILILVREYMVVKMVISFAMGSCISVNYVIWYKLWRLSRAQSNKIHILAQPIGKEKQIGSFTEKIKLRKSLVTLISISAVYLVCYAPYLCYVIAASLLGSTQAVNDSGAVTTSIVFIASTINPLVYCMRIANIRSAVVASLRRMKPQLE